MDYYQQARPPATAAQASHQYVQYPTQTGATSSQMYYQQQPIGHQPQQPPSYQFQLQAASGTANMDYGHSIGWFPHFLRVIGKVFSNLTISSIVICTIVTLLLGIAGLCAQYSAFSTSISSAQLHSYLYLSKLALLQQTLYDFLKHVVPT
ncbi:unnamed protein product [Cylicostephanus goldi]|uniref:Uncharacterized protein n=1 Tax=Cylicostephanus goldi TaxID=71465 RepID=A0A3P6Q4A0_CYLGO|nr:unnamed protein product [Cylicostephanus goldi]